MQLATQQGEIAAGTTLCKPCGILCEICIGPSDSECNLCINASRNGVCVESCEPSGECNSSTLYPALDSSIEIINNVTRRCEAPPAGFPLGTVVGGAITGVIIMVMVVGCGLLLCMCFRLGPFKSLKSFPIITIQFNKPGKFIRSVHDYEIQQRLYLYNIQYEGKTSTTITS